MASVTLIEMLQGHLGMQNWYYLLYLRLAKARILSAAGGPHNCLVLMLTRLVLSANNV